MATSSPTSMRRSTSSSTRTGGSPGYSLPTPLSSTTDDPQWRSCRHHHLDAGLDAVAVTPTQPSEYVPTATADQAVRVRLPPGSWTAYPPSASASSAGTGTAVAPSSRDRSMATSTLPVSKAAAQSVVEGDRHGDGGSATATGREPSLLLVVGGLGLGADGGDGAGRLGAVGHREADLGAGLELVGPAGVEVDGHDVLGGRGLEHGRALLDPGADVGADGADPHRARGEGHVAELDATIGLVPAQCVLPSLHGGGGAAVECSSTVTGCRCAVAQIDEGLLQLGDVRPVVGLDVEGAVGGRGCPQDHGGLEVDAEREPPRSTVDPAAATVVTTPARSVT